MQKLEIHDKREACAMIVAILHAMKGADDSTISGEFVRHADSRHMSYKSQHMGTDVTDCIDVRISYSGQTYYRKNEKREENPIEGLTDAMFNALALFELLKGDQKELAERIFFSIAQHIAENAAKDAE